MAWNNSCCSSNSLLSLVNFLNKNSVPQKIRQSSLLHANNYYYYCNKISPRIINFNKRKSTDQSWKKGTIDCFFTTITPYLEEEEEEKEEEFLKIPLNIAVESSSSFLELLGLFLFLLGMCFGSFRRRNFPYGFIINPLVYISLFALLIDDTFFQVSKYADPATRGWIKGGKEVQKYRNPAVMICNNQSCPPGRNEREKNHPTITDKLKPTSANSSPLTPLTFLERAAVIYGDCPSIVYNDSIHSTWSQTHVRCLRLASALVSIGINRGDVVSVVAPNVPAMYELHFAIPMAGAVINTINLRLDARTISILLQHSESKLVFVDYQSESVILEALSLFSPNSPKPLLVLIPDDSVESKSNKSSSSSRNEFFTTYEAMMEQGNPEFKWLHPRNEFEPIALNYTSGTTSSPKGVVHSHRGLFIVSVDSLLVCSMPQNPVYLWTLPMFHANGWSYSWGMAAVGGTNICLRKFDADVIYSSIRKHKVTHMCGAPAVLTMLSNSPSGNRKPLENPVRILTGGAPPPAPVLLRIEALGFIVIHGYGLTETGGISAICSWQNKWNKLPATERARLKARQGVKSIGMMELDVVEPESGVSVKRDGKTLGEVVLRGAAVMLGYLKDPVGTSKCMKEDGWFYTGDVAVMHPDGYLEIKDRSKDVIISGGENLSSVEVETVLYTHPAVNEAAVVARPDKFWGETLCAFVSLRKEVESKPTEKEIREFCRKKLPRYMVPRTVVFKEELPKTSTGKIQKFVLRDIAKKLKGNPKI